MILKPSVRAAVQMEQHPRQRPTGTPTSMHSSFAALPYQPGGLQGLLHPGVTQPHVMLFTQLLVKMPHVEIRVLLLIQPQDLFHGCQRYPLRAGLPLAMVEQPVIAELFVALFPASHLTITDADDLGCLLPGDLLGQGS